MYTVALETISGLDAGRRRRCQSNHQCNEYTETYCRGPLKLCDAEATLRPRQHISKRSQHLHDSPRMRGKADLAMTSMAPAHATNHAVGTASLYPPPSWAMCDH
jgi:hypothetical protein